MQTVEIREYTFQFKRPSMWTRQRNLRKIAKLNNRYEAETDPEKRGKIFLKLMNVALWPYLIDPDGLRQEVETKVPPLFLYKAVWKIWTV